jgi:hypothetical protein
MLDVAFLFVNDKLDAIKSSWAISHVNPELKSSVLENGSFHHLIIRGIDLDDGDRTK